MILSTYPSLFPLPDTEIAKARCIPHEASIAAVFPMKFARFASLQYRFKNGNKFLIPITPGS